jgi:hypothetical protein
MSNDNTALSTIGKPTALIPSSFGEIQSLSDTLAKSQYVPDAFKGKPADIFLAIAYGMELGFPPIASLRAVAVIKGKPTLYADAMVGLVLGSGKAELFECVESDGTKATYETRRKGSTRAIRKSFSLDDAKAAGLLSNGTYKAYPRQMLEARAKAHLARDVFPDLLNGIYSAEEMSEVNDRPIAAVAQFKAPEPEIVIDAEVVDEAVANAARAIEAAKTVADLNSLADQITALPDAAKADLRVQFKAKARTLKQAAAKAEADAQGAA